MSHHVQLSSYRSVYLRYITQNPDLLTLRHKTRSLCILSIYEAVYMYTYMFVSQAIKMYAYIEEGFYSGCPKILSDTQRRRGSFLPVCAGNHNQRQKCVCPSGTYTPRPRTACIHAMSSPRKINTCIHICDSRYIYIYIYIYI